MHMHLQMCLFAVHTLTQIILIHHHHTAHSQVVNFVYEGLDKSEPLHTIARNLVAFCLESDKQAPSTDNITATLVLFKDPAL